MPSQRQKALRAQIQREAAARRAEACHAEALKKEAVKAKEEAARQEAEARTTPQRTGGAFANDTPAPLPPRPPQPASRHPALRRTNPRNVDTEELLRDARDEGEPTPEVVDDVRAPLALRRALQPPIKPWVGADGCLMAVWECRQSGVFSAPIAVCSSCGYCRPASGLDEPFDNGAHLFADGLVANEQQVTMFDCRRCLRQGITSRPFAIGGAGRRTAQEIEVWQPPPIEPTEEQQLEMKKWRQLKYDVNDKDYQKGLEESKITAAAERFVRRDQNRMLLGAHGVRVLEACILDDTCKKRLAAFRRAAAAELPFPFTFQTEAVVSENTPLPNAVAVENVLRAFETDVVAILARAWNREGSGRLEAEKAAIELAEPLRTLRAELCAQRRGNKTDADALNDFRRAVREALREAQKFRKDWERTVGRREHELLSGGVDASVAARWPVPHYRAAFSRDPMAHELRLVPTSLKLASEYKRATHRNLRHSDRWANVQFGFKDVDVVERLVTDDGELAPIRCCGRVYCYVYDKGPKPVATFLAPLPDDSDPAFRSVPALIASLGDFEGVPDAKRGKYIGNSFSTTLPTSRLKRHEVEVAPDIYHDGHNFSDGCGLISPALARDAARRARHDESDGGGAMQVRFGGSKGMLVVDPRMGPTVRRVLLSPSMVKAPSGDLRLEVKEFASIKKEGNMLFLQVLVCLEHLLGDAAHLLHELLRVFIRKTLMWTPVDVDGSGGGYSGDATGEQLARLSTALKALQVVDESLELEGDDEEDLVDLRLRGPLGVDGKPEEASVLKAIRAALTLAKNKMSIPCDHLWLAFCVCDRWVGLKEGECLVAGGEYRGKLLVWRSPCTHPGDVRKLTAVAPPAGLDCRSLRNLLVLSAEGPRPVADMMAGGDYDGDKIYCLVAEGTAREIVLRVNPVEPATYAARDDRGDDALQAAAAANAARVAEVAFSPRATEARSSDLHGPISSLRLILEAGPIVAESAFAWKVLADHYGAASKEAVAMGSVAARALDLRATGELEALGRDLAKAKNPLRRGLVCPAWAATGKVPPWMKIGTGKNLVLAGIWHQLQVTEDTVEKRMKQLAVRDEASRRAASAAVEKQLKAVKEYSKCTSVPQPETSRSPEREGRVLDDLAAAKRKVDVFAGGLKHAAAQLWSDELLTWARKDPRRVKRLEKELGAFVADSRRTAHSLRPMRRAERRKAHAVCEVYGVGTRSYDRSPERHIRILREPGAPAPSLPDVLLSEAAALPAVSVLPEPGASDRATGAADRAPAPEIDERRAVDDVSAEAGDAAAAEEAAALQRALDESKARADEDAAAEAAERRSAELIVATMEARDEAEVKLADAVARQREAEDLARATALSARDIYGHEERKGGDSDTDYSDDEDDEAAPLAMLQPGPMAWTIGGGALTYAARAVEDRHAGVVFSTEDVDLERALAASLAETSAKDDELERALAASRAESCRHGDDEEQLRAVLALSAREASAPAVADEPDEVIDDAVVAASLQAVEADAERRRLAIDEEVARAYAALGVARPLPPPAAAAPAAATRDDAAIALVGGAPAGYALVARFLSQLERPHLFTKFLSQNVDDEVLPSLNESDLDDMAIPSDSDAARAILGGIRDAEFIAGLRV